MIDRETVQRIMDSANIVDVVSEFVTLKRAGVNYRGLCPVVLRVAGTRHLQMFFLRKRG